MRKSPDTAARAATRALFSVLYSDKVSSPESFDIARLFVFVEDIQEWLLGSGGSFLEHGDHLLNFGFSFKDGEGLGGEDVAETLQVDGDVKGLSLV